MTQPYNGMVEFFSIQGDKNEGFNVLYQNMKSGSLAAKELTDFFRESAKLEEENAKTHAKLAKQVRSRTVILFQFGLDISTLYRANI